MASTPGAAVPGTPVPANAEVSPGGAQGTAGSSAGASTTQQAFTVPQVGQTQTVNVTDASTFIVGQMIYLDQAGGGPGSPGTLQITAKNGNQLTLLNPYPIPTIPPADTTQAGLLKQLSGAVTDYVAGDNSCRNLIAAIPLASSTAAGLAAQLSGVSTDYLGGDNATHSLPITITANSAKIGGLLIQWGTAAGGSANIAITFPVPYSSAAPFVFITSIGYSGGTDLATTSTLPYSVGRQSTTGFTAYPRYINSGGAAGVGGQSFFWLAIGPA